jgi:hypothetical protein
MSAAETTKPNRTPEQNGLDLGDRLYNAHAVLRAVVHQLHEVEGDQVSDPGAEVHDAGRALRLAGGTVHRVAELLSCCQVIAPSDDVRAELNALLAYSPGSIE